MGFFDAYPRFQQTSKTTPQTVRLNARFDAIIRRNAGMLFGKRVIDIASHDGRWSFAAIKNGAKYVLGIESRRELVENANANVGHYGVADRCLFVCGDALAGLRNVADFDVVLCLGFYYHTAKHVELFDLMERTGASLIVVDTAVVAPEDERHVPQGLNYHHFHPANPCFIEYGFDLNENESLADAESATRKGQTIVGKPSRAFMTMIGAHFGFSVSRFDWATYLREHPLGAETDLRDYFIGWRETFYFERAHEPFAR